MQWTSEAVTWHRIRRSGLIEPFDEPEDMARALLGVQSQFVPPAGMAIRGRSAAAFTEEDLLGSLHDSRTLIRTWGQRNTVHVYAKDDWATFVAATQVLSTYKERLIHRLGADAEACEAAIASIERYLADHDRGCRADFLEADPSLEPWLQYGTGLVMDISRRGLACQAHLEGGKSYFAHRQRWAPDLKWNPPETEVACIELARRYLHTYGPATVRDLQFWMGAKASEAKRWVASLGDEVVAEDVTGRPALVALAADADVLGGPAPPLQELPLRVLHRFDPLVLAHKDKSWLVDDSHYKAVWRKAGYVEAVVLRHGRIQATWRYDKKGKGISASVSPFGRIPAKERKEIERLVETLLGYFARPISSIEFE